MGWDYKVNKQGELHILVSRWYNSPPPKGMGNLKVEVIAKGFEPNEPVQVEVLEEKEGKGMTSGYMVCPVCKKEFQWAGYEGDKWIEYPEPWKCNGCKSSIVVDKQKGYGLVPLSEAKEKGNGTT